MMRPRSPASSFIPRLSPRRGDGRPILAVGGRALVTAAHGDASRVALTDDRNVPTGATIGLDVEVEIVAWRPRGSSGTRYRVRCATEGIEGWLDAASVRPVGAPSAPPAPETPPTAPEPPRGATTFGARKTH